MFHLFNNHKEDAKNASIDLKKKAVDISSTSKKSKIEYGSIIENGSGEPCINEFSSPVVVGKPVYSFEPRNANPAQLGEGALYRPDTIIDGWSTEFLTVRGATLRGYDHRYYGLPRQDDFSVGIILDKNWVIMALADGVSGAKLSHIGSTTVTRYALEFFANQPLSCLDDVEKCWDSLFSGAAWALVERTKTALGLDNADVAKAEQLFATTLVCAVVAPSTHGASARVAAVGDSGAWLADSKGFSKLLGGKSLATDGITSSAVSGLPRVPDIVQSTRVEVLHNQVLLLGSDGFGDPLGDGDGDLGSLFRNCFFPNIPSMLEFSHTLDFSRENFDDDRTLIAVWPRHCQSS